MPGPSERMRQERVEKARKAVAEEIVRRYENSRAKGADGFSFRVRIAPTVMDYRKGRCGCGGYDPRDSDSRDAFVFAVSELVKSYGIKVHCDSTGAPEWLLANEGALRHAYRETGRSFDDAEERTALLALLGETARVCSDMPWALAWVDLVTAEARCAGGISRIRGRSGERYPGRRLRGVAGVCGRGFSRMAACFVGGGLRRFEILREIGGCIFREGGRSGRL